MRSSMAERYEWMFAKLAQEYDLVGSANLLDFDLEQAVAALEAEATPALRIVKGGEAPPAPDEDEKGITLYQRIHLRAVIMQRMIDVARRHAQVLGLQTEAGTTINVGPGAGASVLALTKIEAPDDQDGQERLAGHLREISQLVGGPGS